MILPSCALKAAAQNLAFFADLHIYDPFALHQLAKGNLRQVVVGTARLDGIGTIRQGFVEMSNVRLVEDMTDLIMAQRAYEANSKAITTSDDMLSIVNSLKR